MKVIYKIMILCSVAMLTFSCTDQFGDINTDPNRTMDVDHESLFTGSPVSTMMTLNCTGTDFSVEGLESSVWIFGNYSGHISMASGPYPQYGSDGKANALWENFYVRCIKPLVTIEQDKGNDPAFANRVAIARIWKSYVFSQMVALWGPVPYFDACKGVLYAKYDSESAIYRDILEQLKINADALKENGDVFSSAGKDPVFQASTASGIAKWRKFAHNIRLRVAMNLSDYDEAEIRNLARTVLREELDGEHLISSNAENISMNYAQEKSFRNPFDTYTRNSPNAEGGYPVIHEQLMMRLIGYDDPRLAVFCKKATYMYKKGDYLGRPSTTRMPPNIQLRDNPHTNAKQDYYSYVANEFTEAQAKWTIISYPEIACIKAEAAYRGFWKTRAEAKQFYEESIYAFSDRYRTPIDRGRLDEYKDHWGIKWYEGGEPYDFDGDTIVGGANSIRLNAQINSSAEVNVYRDYLRISSCVLSDRVEDNPSQTIHGDALPQDANYKRIIMQHWMALFFQGTDAWTLLRRTQQLQFSPVWNPDTDNGTSYTDHGGSSWGYLPQRLPYPDSEIRDNRAARAAIDMLEERSNSIQTKLKFAKPVKGSVVEIPEYPWGVSFRLAY